MKKINFNEMKKNKRILFLLGAGAAHHWFDDKLHVTTNTITSEICCSDKLCCLLFQKLSESTDKPNFESIINAIENLYQYYFGKKDFTDYDNSIIFKPCEDIQKYFDGLTNDKIVYKLANLFERCIEIVISKIKEYDNAIKSKMKSEKDEQFLKFLKFSKAQRNVIRAYTLNYDQMFTDIDYENDMKFFDGFLSNQIEDRPSGIKQNYNQYSVGDILSRPNDNCFFNLHGSIYWIKRHDRIANKQAYAKSSEVFNGLEWGNMHKGSNTASNKNERILHTPIITGFKKLQRLNIEPFNAFWNSFYRDCHSADVFVFIGYSFGDAHINNILSNALIANKKVLIIDYNPQKDKRKFELESIIGDDINDIIDNGVNKKGNIRYFSEGINDFLELEQYKTVESFF